MHWTVSAGLAGIVLSLGGIFLGTWLIVRLPPDHFVSTQARPADRHFVLHALWVTVRNTLGLVLIALGIALLVLPGQGLLTILIGISIMDLPYKRHAVEWAVSLKTVRHSLNWIRRKAHRPPLQFPEQNSPL